MIFFRGGRRADDAVGLRSDPGDLRAVRGDVWGARLSQRAAGGDAGGAAVSAALIADSQRRALAGREAGGDRSVGGRGGARGA